MARVNASEGRRGRLEDWRALGVWLLGLGLITVVLARFREDLDGASKALAYLMVVLIASARNGRLVGLTMALASFLAFNFFLLSPYYTLTLENPLNWWVLIAFLVTGVVAAELFHRAQRALAVAENRAREIDRLSALGAESLSVANGMDAVTAIARVIQAELPVRSACIVMLTGDDGPRILAEAPEGAAVEPNSDLVRFSVAAGQGIATALDGTPRSLPPHAGMESVLDSRHRDAAILLPLRVHDRVLGVVQLADPQGLHVDRSKVAFADSLAYYAALAVERVRLEAEAGHVEALRKADRLKDALLASVSHDLRTPLTSIRATAAEIRSEGIESAAIIEQEADRLNRFVTDLLDLSRIRAGALALDVQINAAEDLIGAALLEVRGLPGAERLEVQLPAGEVIPIGRFDFVHALRALVNLLENALRHTTAEGFVHLVLTLEDQTLVFEVRDRGPGIAPEARELIFEPFYRLRGPNDGTGGTGLGLAIARSLAEAQGGSIDFQARSGGGSIFALRLPREELREIP